MCYKFFTANNKLDPNRLYKLTFFHLNIGCNIALLTEIVIIYRDQSMNASQEIIHTLRPLRPDLAKNCNFGTKSLWQFLEGPSLWQNFEPALANFYAIGQIFIVINSQIFEK